MSRFVVRECHGYAIPDEGITNNRRGGQSKPGMTVTVHDAAQGFRVVRTFRTERQRAASFQPFTRVQRFAQARREARLLARRLNAKESA